MRGRLFYVIARTLDGAASDIPQSPLLNGVPIESWVEHPQAKNVGSLDASLFALVVKEPNHIDRFYNK